MNILLSYKKYKMKAKTINLSPFVYLVIMAVVFFVAL